MPLSDARLWLATQVLDYGWMGSIALVVSLLFGDDAFQYTTLGLSAACTLLGALSVAVLSARERVYFVLFADRLPRCKQKPLAAKITWYLFQTGSASMISIFAMHKSSLIFWTPPALTLSYWLSAFVPFYALLALRDVFFLGPLHPLLHSPRWYHLHKLHHESTKDAQSLHAFYIDLLDLLIENVGAPFLLFGAQWLLGLTVGIPWMASVLLTFHDGALHSVNPYSVMYYNPVLDHVLQANVHHQLHHALNRGYYLFVPWGHLLPDRRRADCRRYNEVFKTDFTFS